MNFAQDAFKLRSVLFQVSRRLEERMRLDDLFPALTGYDPELPRDVDSPSPLDLMRRANTLADSKSFPAALNYYDVALQNEPRAPEIWFNLGKTLSDMGKIAEAIICYDK